MEYLRLSVIISCYNASNIIERCLTALINQTYNYIEIIVVDANSNDGTSEIIESEFPSVILIKLKTIVGVGKALNIGMRHANGDIFAFDFNTDEVASTNWAEELIKAHIKYGPKHIIATTRLLKNNLVDEYGVLLNTRSKNHKIGHGEMYNPNRKSQKCDYTGLSSFRKELIEDIGYKNEHYEFYAADADFNLRAKLKGYTIRTNTKSTTVHMLSYSKSINYVKYYERMTFGIHRLVFIHGTRRRIVKNLIRYNLISPIYLSVKSIVKTGLLKENAINRRKKLDEITGRYLGLAKIIRTIRQIKYERKRYPIKQLF